MKTNNPLIDTLVESQTMFVQNWMDSAKKMQSAFANGNIASEGQSLYKEYFDKQMNVLNSMRDSGKNMFDQQASANPQEFFKNWFNQQATYAKQMADFNQSISSSFMNFGRPANDYMSAFGQSNNAFTNIYNNWLNTLNSSFDAMSKNMNNGFSKDVFTNYMQGNQVYAKMQEFFAPMLNAMQKGQFNMDAFRNYFTADAYANLSRQMFGNLYDQAAVKEMMDNGMKQMQDFFANQNGLAKEYYAQVQNMMKEMPQMFAANQSTAGMQQMYSQMQSVFSKNFEPLMKLVNAGREKDAMEGMLNLMDRVAQYSFKQAEMQNMLQETARKSVEAIASEYTEKFSKPESMTHMPTPQELFNEWVKVNEQLYTDLFASEEFSKVKGEALNLTNELKKHFEKQFENTFGNYPVVFKSEVAELEKTIYDLKKQVKELQAKLQLQGTPELGEDERKAKNNKK